MYMGWVQASPPNALHVAIFKLITFSTEAFSESLNFQIHKAAASN